MRGAMAIIIGNNNRNVLIGTGRNDIVRGLGGNDTLVGFGGDDVLDGGFGRDAMAGFAGDDTYVVDSAGDRVIERAGEGIDRVVSAISYTLGANLENLVLVGGARAGTGNLLN